MVVTTLRCFIFVGWTYYGTATLTKQHVRLWSLLCVVSTSLNVLVVFDTVVSCLNLTPMSLLVVALILDEQRVRLFYCVRAWIGRCYCLAFGAVLGRTLITCMRYCAIQTRCNGNDDSALMFVGMHYFGVQIHYNQWRWRLRVDVCWMVCRMYGTAIVLARSTQTNSAYVCIAVCALALEDAIIGVRAI